MDNNGQHNWLTYVLCVGIAAWGGLVNYVSQLRTSGVSFSWSDFFAELIVCMFAGFIVGISAISLGVDPLLSWALSGLGGHAGSRTLFVLKRNFLKRLESWTDKG